MMADVGFLSANENLDGLSYISLVCKRKFGIPKFWFADHFFSSAPSEYIQECRNISFLIFRMRRGNETIHPLKNKK
jgi:hypothetical protein